jgi:hypothetical protein
MFQKTAALLLLPVLLHGCTTKKGMAAKPLDVGIKAIYAAPFDKVKRAAFDTMSELDFSIKEEKWDGRSENCYLILGSQGIASAPLGRLCRVVIEKSDTEQTLYVHVESKTLSKDAQAVDEAVAKDFHSRIEKRLAK